MLACRGGKNDLGGRQAGCVRTLALLCGGWDAHGIEVWSSLGHWVLQSADT